ncbi:MAG: hypothetical protein CVV24_03650 [Ignavibacteriae bacterium HGW-Ignavibacteriae-3]|nr:MAG: hypothetical protein CVV24_03650 [Ignavibacteriae bacterium HGW-Ignavibacteriae-3]
MNENELYPSLVEKLHKDFSLEKDSLPAVSDLSLIREHLINKVTELISRDYDRFLNNLYRIDVNEKKVSEILHAKDRTTIPERLADLIIERQMQRVKTQILYRQGKF